MKRTKQQSKKLRIVVRRDGKVVHTYDVPDPRAHIIAEFNKRNRRDGFVASAK